MHFGILRRLCMIDDYFKSKTYLDSRFTRVKEEKRFLIKLPEKIIQYGQIMRITLESPGFNCFVNHLNITEIESEDLIIESILCGDEYKIGYPQNYAKIKFHELVNSISYLNIVWRVGYNLNFHIKHETLIENVQTDIKLSAIIGVKQYTF